jgi:hypothetical protein
MTIETFKQAKEIVARIEVLEVILRNMNLKEGNRLAFHMNIDDYQKELDDLNYKLYHLN